MTTTAPGTRTARRCWAGIAEAGSACHPQRDAICICAALSGLLPLLTALVAWLATRRAAVAWTAGLLVVVQTRLWPTDASPDATLAYQLTLLGALAAFHLARDGALGARGLVALGAALALPVYVRGEGFVVAASTLPFLLFTGAPALLRSGIGRGASRRCSSGWASWCCPSRCATSSSSAGSCPRGDRCASG